MDRKKLIIVIMMIIILVLIIFILIYGINTKNEDENITIEERNEGGEEYNITHLDNFDIKIEGLSDEIEDQIKDLEDFQIQFKEFVYLNGLVDADIANVISYNINENELQIDFQLNNPNQTKMYCIISILEQEYEFFEEE